VSIERGDPGGNVRQTTGKKGSNHEFANDGAVEETGMKGGASGRCNFDQSGGLKKVLK